MVEKIVTPARKVIDFSRYQQERGLGRAQAILARLCRHCGAELSEGENEDECSSAFNFSAARLREMPRKYYAD